MNIQTIFDQNRKGDRRGYVNRCRKTDHQREEDDLQHNDRISQNNHTQSSPFFGPKSLSLQKKVSQIKAV
jgi:hypothetical protein